MMRALGLSLLVVATVYVLAQRRLPPFAGPGRHREVDPGGRRGHAPSLWRHGCGHHQPARRGVGLTTANASIFTGARTSYALGCDVSGFRYLGRWNARTGTPVNALLVQGAVSLGLIVLGTALEGFQTMVDYTAPVFWTFFLLTGLAFFELRRREPHLPRPFRVPLYPVTPVIFCATCTYLLYSSVAFTGTGAFVGVAVLVAGAILLAFQRERRAQPLDLP